MTSDLARTALTSISAVRAGWGALRLPTLTRTHTTPKTISTVATPTATPIIRARSLCCARSSPRPSSSSAAFGPRVGCSSSAAPMASFSQEAKQHYAASGIELAQSAAEHCQRSGLNVLQGPIDRTNLARLGRQDVIVMLDVIEHLPDPLGSLQLCADYLDPGGVLVITTGDFGSAAAKITGKAWRLMTPPQHLWYFTTESMQRLSARTGLRGRMHRSSLEARSGLPHLVPVTAHDGDERVAQ